MSFLELTKDELNKCFTENGDRAFLSTGSFCLDLFSLGGSLRWNIKSLLELVLKAYQENKATAIKLLFYLRDIRGGLGERNAFRLALNILGNFYPDVTKQIIEYVVEYGRYDDLLSLLNTPVEEDVIKFIKKQLNDDIKSFNQGKNVSLLSKWLPSINASNGETISLAKELSNKLGYTYKEYRQVLSKLRSGKIIENNLRLKDYTFDYDKIPGKAFLKYRNAFLANDNERYREFLGLNDNKPRGNVKLDTVAPYEIVRMVNNANGTYGIEAADKIWEQFKLADDNSKTIVVRDGSGSMTCHLSNHLRPLDIADAFSILYSEHLTGEFKNTFITFSEKPKLVSLNNIKTLSEKLYRIHTFDDVSTTNIEKVYNLIISVYNRPDFKREDAIDRIVIISDMEFNQGVNYKKSTYKTFKEKFEKLGYKIPEVVFLNVCSRNATLPVTIDESNVKLIGGSSKYILDMIIKNDSNAPYEFMMDCLKKYSFVDGLNLEV